MVGLYSQLQAVGEPDLPHLRSKKELQRQGQHLGLLGLLPCIKEKTPTMHKLDRCFIIIGQAHTADFILYCGIINYCE